MAFPYTLPCAVGGYDLPHRGLWRRPEDRHLPTHENREHLSEMWSPLPSRSAQKKLPSLCSTVGPACAVQLRDLVHGLSQRIEGQFRRHWGFIPAVWNLFFRERVNLGASLNVKHGMPDGKSSNVQDTDAAIAAADLVQKLETGKYTKPNGKICRINNDASKLPFAVGLSDLQRKLLADFRFRCGAIPGSQEIRTKIGRLGLWACVNYRNGIFCTISPGERHNYLACRLSRYRQDDPFVARKNRRKWGGKDAPSLEPTSEDRFEDAQPQSDDEVEFEIPGYNLRRLLLAEDPLSAANAFFVQIRTVLATMLGVRMCPNCPHCSETKWPCQDALGSSAEAMGGIAGRVDALFGAVEAQKTTGGLHYHFFMFVQRLHQYATLKEIAEKLEEGLVQAEELKHFLGEICCERYSDVEQFNLDRASLEKNFPTYSEKTECPGTAPRWGECKLGRLPAYAYRDARAAPESFTRSAPDRTTSPVNTSEGAESKGWFNWIFQYLQSRCQYHIHRLVVDPKTKQEKRLIPNACATKSNKRECKHEAPWTNRVSPEWMTAPLLVCKGIAKQFQLRTSGARNWLGQTLGMRNEAWVNGCMPGLCVAFAGSNSDVKPNDRLPIIEKTREQFCRRKRCIEKKKSLRKATRAAQRTQTVAMGYFGGYIGKRQPAGTLETKKCVDKLFTLREKIKGRGKAAQLRAASGRMVTDLEMNSTYRGAVEVYNMCSRNRPDDVTFAECIRTFNAHDTDGRSWMSRLDTQENKMRESGGSTYVPPTPKPNVRTDRSRVNECDAYGLRPLEHPWALLSPYEFMKFWRCVPLLIPNCYPDGGART